ncbi:MAG: hypothetical protein C4293_20475 [Nitrospiraceae bacterium]
MIRDADSIILPAGLREMLKDILESLKVPDHYYSNVLARLKELTETQGLGFLSEGKEGWELLSFARPGKRTFLGIEDKRKNSTLVLV